MFTSCKLIPGEPSKALEYSLSLLSLRAHQGLRIACGEGLISVAQVDPQIDPAALSLDHPLRLLEVRANCFRYRPNICLVRIGRSAAEQASR
jgi:hypothetical protein